MGLIDGDFTEKQKQVINSSNEKVVDPAYALLSGVEHISFQDVEKAIPNISIDRLDWKKATQFSQPRSREEIRAWIKKCEAEWFSPFSAKSVGNGKHYRDARSSLAAIAEYICVMLDSSEGSSNWSGDCE